MMKKWMIRLVTLCVLLSSTEVFSMGVTPEETYAWIQDKGAQVLFIDVRDPIEIMFVGATDKVDINIPFLIANRYDWDAENNRFRMERNPHFVQEVQAALAAKGLDEDAIIITMCRSGSERGEPSALFLKEQGFANARFVMNGFQGDAKGEGEMAGRRVINGWQNVGLPWQPRLAAEKIYRAKPAP